jgi:hypothetical protein
MDENHLIKREQKIKEAQEFARQYDLDFGHS